MPRLSRILAGTALALTGGALAYYFVERRTPEPEYTVVSAEGDFELRDYPPLLVASIEHAGERDKALNRGFGRLAEYIFAKDQGGEEIGMTAPVLQDRNEKIGMTAPVLQDGGSGEGFWRTRFVMPARYTRETLPSPPGDITIEVVPARRVAALSFSGSPDSANLSQRESELRSQLARRGIQPAGEAEYAFYNSPFIPPFMRRNEILIPVEVS